MAFSFAMTKKYQDVGGQVVEEGTWNGSGVTTGDITVDTASQPEIIKITDFSLSSDGDTAVVAAQDVAPTTLKLTFTSGDTGKYKIKGNAA